MLQRLTNSESIEIALYKIRALLVQHAEWFLTSGQSFTQALRRDELEINIAQDRLLFSCWTEKGVQSWRVLSWTWTGQALLLHTPRKVRKQEPLIELVPRASASSISLVIKAAREMRCEKIAKLANDWIAGAKIERYGLSSGMSRGQPGKYARIILRHKRRRIAVTASVVTMQHSSVDAYLSSALLWFRRLSARSHPPESMWLVVPEGVMRALFHRLALLRASLRGAIRVFKIDRELTLMEEVRCPLLSELWLKRLSRFPPVPPAILSDLTRAIVEQAPDAIDVTFARSGQTLRYFGLPFARVRSLMGQERVWFGLDSSNRCLLQPETISQWDQLLNNLREYRSASASDRRHALYRNASESWLESLLRKDITRLDPGLIIAPLHAQFRTTHGGKLGVRPIDMLALRQDGRLVVIELKVSADREHVLQGAEYWRRVEAHRRRGHIAGAKLFGERTIIDKSPLVYLAAPLLSFHRSFQSLASCVAPEIEMYRFDLNEDWRSGVCVVRRMKVN